MAQPQFSKQLKADEFVMARALREVDMPGRRQPLLQRSVTACGGLEFITSEWRRVPEGCEAEVENNPHLEFQIMTREKAEKLEAEQAEASAAKVAAAVKAGKKAAPQPEKAAEEEPSADSEESASDLSKMSFADLDAMASSMGLDVPPIGKSKKKLIAAIEEAQQ